jgi:hypothetical protein
VNITHVEKPFRRAGVRLNPEEYKSAWLGNKAVYRTRLAMAEGGELIIIAPGVKRFGEDAQADALIRKYGYIGRQAIIKLCAEQEDLRSCLSAAAHLIHASPEGRFTVTYAAPLLGRQAVESVGYGYMDMDEAEAAALDCDIVINEPALGLWAAKGRL